MGARWRDQGDSTAAVATGTPERWPLFDATYWRALVGACALLWVGLGAFTVVAMRQPGGLGKAFNASTRSPRGSGIYLAIVALGYTGVMLGLRQGRRWTVVCGDRGMRLEHGGLVKWQVMWADVCSWYPETSPRGQLLALVVTDRAQHERRFSFGFFAPTGAVAQRVRQAVAGHTPQTPGSGLPRAQRQPRWVYYALVIVLVATAIEFAVIWRNMR